MMQYKNLHGDSGVVEYEPGSDYIKVRFVHSSTIYVFTYAKPGSAHVDEMNRLAEAGQGLARYIRAEVYGKHERTE